MAAADATGFDISGDLSSRASATGGKIGSQLINNTSGGGIGIVKLLAIAGVCVVLFRVWRR